MIVKDHWRKMRILIGCLLHLSCEENLVKKCFETSNPGFAGALASRAIRKKNGPRFSCWTEGNLKKSQDDYPIIAVGKSLRKSALRLVPRLSRGARFASYQKEKRTSFFLLDRGKLGIVIG